VNYVGKLPKSCSQLESAVSQGQHLPLKVLQNAPCSQNRWLSCFFLIFFEKKFPILPATTHPLWTLPDFKSCQKENAAGIFFTDRVVQHALRGNEERKERWKKEVVNDWFNNTADAGPDFIIRANKFLREDMEDSSKGISIFESVVETHSYVVFMKMSALAAFLFFGYLEARKLDFASAAGAASGCRTFLHGFTNFVSSEGQTLNLSKTDTTTKRALLIIIEGLLCMMHLAHSCLEVVTEVMGPIKTVKERDRNASREMSGVGQGQGRTNHTLPNAHTRMEGGFQTTTAADGDGDRDEGGFDREGNMSQLHQNPSVTPLRFLEREITEDDIRRVQRQGEMSLSIQIAARHGRADFVERLVRQYKCDVNNLDLNGNNVLHLAAIYGHADVVATLLDSGLISDLNIKNKYWETALDCAKAGQIAYVMYVKNEEFKGPKKFKGPRWVSYIDFDFTTRVGWPG
jgi:hypothetical protein